MGGVTLDCMRIMRMQRLPIRPRPCHSFQAFNMPSTPVLPPVGKTTTPGSYQPKAVG